MKPDKAKKANLSINGGSKAWAGRVLVLMITVLLLAFNLNLEAKPHSRKDKDKKKGNPFHRVEITGVDHTECVSPNEDGKKDRMELNAYFDGKPRHKVYAFLFIKKNRRIVRFLAGQSRFSPEGKAAIRLEWDGKDWRKRPVANGFYRLHLYYFNFPSLFNSKGAKHHKAYNKLIKAILKHKKKGHRAVKEWMGEVSVDTEAPLITVNAPADGLETTVQQTETAGIASGGDKLTINNNPVSLSGTTFTTTLPLAMGPNVFTYVLEDCAGNRAVKSVTVTRIEEPLPPEAAFNADPLSIQSGSSSTLTWTSLNAGTVTIDNNIGAVALNGSVTVTPNQTTTYTITAEGPGGSVSASVTVEVTFPAPTVTLTASPSSITSGDSSTLSWTSTGAGSVSIDNGIGSVDLNGSITVTPNETVTYTITAEGPGGTATAEATVEVTNPAPEVTLTVSPESVEEGNPVTLSWSSINADSVSIDNGIGPVDLNGSLTVSPVATTTYTVTAEGPGGTETAEATVEVTINPEHFTAVYGRVFDAESGSPLADAVVSASGKTVQSDGDGYWQLAFGSGGLIKIVISKEGYTNAYRKIRLGTGSEGTVTNAYLTLHDTTTTPIGPEGGIHGNSDGSVEVIVPAGALDIVKEIRATRLSSSKALPGDMNATDNLEFPIGFLFCADFGPDETHFNVPVTIRVQNSWGFEPGTEIPYAYWNKDTHKWVPENAMAKVDDAGEWLEAKVTHFSAWDINSPLSFGGGPPVFDFDPFPEDDECDIGSQVNVSTGTLKNSFSIPGLTVRGGSTGLELVYNSKTAFPSQFVRVRKHSNPNLVDRPMMTGMQVDSPLAGVIGRRGGGGGGSQGSIGGQTNFGGSLNMNFNPSQLGGDSYSLGAMMINGTYPSGRKTGTGFQSIGLQFTNYYPGEYYTADRWGGLPRASTGISSIEPATFTEERTDQVFLVSREESSFGKGWWLRGLQRLHFQNEQVVVIDGDAGYRTYEKGINWADADHGAVVASSNYNMLYRDSMLLPKVVREAKDLLPSRFFEIPASPGTDQMFVIDLGQERELHEIGLDFPKYWNGLNVWDYVDISTSIDNQNWDAWHRHGIPTLNSPAGNDVDPLDGKIDAPLRAEGSPRLVRYIKFRLGFPSSNSSHNGSAIYRIYAIGDETQFTNVDEEKWPKLEFDSDTQRYVLTEFSGDQTVFDTDGKMLEQKDRRGLGVTYQYQGDRLIKIVYPGNAYMAFEYDTNGFLNSIKDSTGRETQIVPDGNGQVKEVVYPDATRREFDYDERGLMTMDKKGIAAKTYSWHSEWPVLTSVTLPNGGIRTVDAGVLKYLLSDPAVNSDPETPVDFPFLENNDGFDSEVTYEDGKVVRYEIGKGSKTIYVNDELEETTTWANKRKNRIPVKIESGADKSELTTIRYNNNLQVERITNSYSDFMWQRVDTQPNTPWVKTDNTTPTTSANTTYTYNADRLVSRVTGYDIDMSYTYDGNSNLLEEKNLLLNKTTKYTYNSDNVLIRTEYPDGKQNQLMYNEKSLLIEIVKNDGTKTVLTRNSRGEVKSITDAENRTFNVERDIMGRVVKETAPSGRTVQYVWSSIGCSSCGTGEVKLTKIVDSGNNEWEFKYDIMGNATDMIYPDGSKITQGYDIANRLTSFTNKRNQLIRYAYDSDGLMVKKTTPEGITDFSYDDKDRLVEVSAPDYHYKYQYGIPGGLSGHTVLQVNNVNTAGWSQHIYNRFGFPTDYYDSFQWHKTYLYNFSQPGGTPIGLAPSIVSYSKWYSSAEHRLVYTYNSGHRLYSKRNDYLKTMKYFSYDANGILSSLRYRNVFGYVDFPDINLDFTRDNSGLITSITGDKGLNVNYNSDLEIASVQHTLPQSFGETYSYDSRGNRSTSLTQSYTYNNLNQLTFTASHTYQYDADGNLIEEKNIATGEIKKYFYNSENRLSRFEHYPSATSPVDTVAIYKYDLLGRRIQKNVNGTVTHFTWEENNLATELDTNYQPIRRYVYGVNKDEAEGYIEFSEVTGSVFDSSKKGWYSFVKDQVGTIYKVYSYYDRQVVDTRSYDTFGNLVSQTGNSTGNLGFQSKYYDNESGLYYFYYRYYHPGNGRFLNEDPIGMNDGFNMYGFVENDPTNKIDPFGLWNKHMHPWIKYETQFLFDAGRASHIFLKNYKDMRKVKVPKSDKYFHCMANCQASRLGPGGSFMAKLISELRELSQEYIFGESPADCNKDRAANRQGRYGDPNKSCKEVCGNLRPPTLDKKY